MSDEEKLSRRTARFWSQVKRSDGCWLWTGRTQQDGYGSLQWFGKTAGAHRIAYQLAKGTIPDGWEIDHECSEHSCVNPEHLHAVTPQENHRLRAERRDGCAYGHKYSFRPDGSRFCRECDRERSTERRRGERKSRVYGDSEKCGRGHLWDEVSTYISPKGHRVCRTCRNERRRNGSSRG